MQQSSSDKNEMLQAVIGFAAIIAFAVIGYIAISRVIALAEGVDPTVQASLTAGMVAIISILVTYWKDRERNRQEAHREQKIRAYSLFYDLMFEALKNEKGIKRNSQGELEGSVSDEFQEKWMNMAREVVFYGSPRVINAFGGFKNNNHSSSNGIESIKKAGRVLLAMRSDIGLSNFGLNEFSVHQVWLKATDETAGAKE